MYHPNSKKIGEGIKTLSHTELIEKLVLVSKYYQVASDNSEKGYMRKFAIKIRKLSEEIIGRIGK